MISISYQEGWLQGLGPQGLSGSWSRGLGFRGLSLELGGGGGGSGLFGFYQDVCRCFTCLPPGLRWVGYGEFMNERCCCLGSDLWYLNVLRFLEVWPMD